MNTMMLLTIGGEGHDRKNRSRQPEIAQTGVQAGMSYYINNTMSMGSDPFAPAYGSVPERTAFPAFVVIKRKRKAAWNTSLA